MSNTSRVSAEIGLNFATDQFRTEVQSVKSGFGDIYASMQAVVPAVDQINDGFSSNSAQTERLEANLSNLGFRVSDLASQMSGLYQAQTRLARGRKDLQAAFDTELHFKVDQTLNADDMKSSQVLEEQLGRSEQLIRQIRSQYAELETQHQREVSLLEDKKRLQGEYLKAKNEVSTGNDDETEDQRIARLQEMKKAIDAHAASEGRIAEIVKKQNSLREHGRVVERGVMETTQDVVRAREQENRQLEEQMRMLKQIRTSEEGEMARSASFDSQSAAIQAAPDPKDVATLRQQYEATNETIGKMSRRVLNMLNTQRDMTMANEDTEEISKQIADEERTLAQLRGQNLRLLQQIDNTEKASAAQKARQAEMIDDALTRQRQSQSVSERLFNDEKKSLSEITAQYDQQQAVVRDIGVELQKLVGLADGTKESQERIAETIKRSVTEEAELVALARAKVAATRDLEAAEKRVASESKREAERRLADQQRLSQSVQRSMDREKKSAADFRHQLDLINSPRDSSLGGMEADLRENLSLLTRIDQVQEDIRNGLSSDSSSEDLAAADKVLVSTAGERSQIQQVILQLSRQITEERKRLAEVERQQQVSAVQAVDTEQQRLQTLQQQLKAREESFVAFERERQSIINEPNVRSTSQLEASDNAAVQRQVALEAKILATTSKISGQEAKINSLKAKRSNELEDQVALEKKINAESRELRAMTSELREDEELLTREMTNRRSIAEQISRNRQSDGQSLRQAVNIMNQLGDRSSQELLVESQITRNRLEMERSLKRALMLGEIEVDQAKELLHTFNRINNSKNASRQLSNISGMNKAGQMAQQGAYAVEDFAVQIERGLIPALSGAGNNINMIAQIAGGPWLAGISTAAIAGLQFAKALGYIGGEAEEMISAVDNANESLGLLEQRMDRMAENETIRFQMSVDTDVESVNRQANAMIDALNQAANKNTEVLTERMAAKVQQEIDELSQASNYLVDIMAGFEVVSVATGSEAEGWIEQERAMEARLRTLENLRDSLSGEEMAAAEAHFQLQFAIEAQNKASQIALDLARSRNQEMQAGVFNELSDQRSLVEVQKENSQGLRERFKIQQQMNELQAQQRIEAGRSLFGEEDMERVAILNQEIVQAQIQLNSLGEKEIANRERALELVEKMRDAEQQIADVITEQNERGNDRLSDANAIRKEMQEVFEAAKAIADATDGTNADSFIHKSLMARFDGQSRELEEFRRNMMDVSNSDQLQANESDQLNTLNAMALVQDRLNAGEMDRQVAISQQAVLSERLLELRKNELTIQEQISDRYEGTQKMLQSRLQDLNSEYQIEARLRKEREKYVKAVRAAVQAGEISSEQARQDVRNYEKMVAAEQQLKDLKLNRDDLKSQIDDLMDESQVEAAPELTAVTRGSDAEASALSRFAKEAVAAGEQKPVVNELVKLGTKLDDVNASIKAIEGITNIETFSLPG